MPVQAPGMVQPLDMDRFSLGDQQALCTNSTLAWAARCNPLIKPYWHTKLIDRYIERLLSEDNDHNYLMVSQPPRTGKTMMSMVYGATKYLAMHPNHHVFLVTHNQRTADKFGRQARDVFSQYAPDMFGVSLDPRTKANAHWKVRGHEGTFTAIGWGGPITGNKVHLMILDDLIKDTEEAMSQNFRMKLWDWWDGTASQRIQDNVELRTKVLSIQTRWHIDDLNGKLIQQERAGGHMRWDKCILPAWADKGDFVIDGEVLMKRGEPLCEEILSLEQIHKLQKTKSRYWWEATYMQRPITQDGILWSADLFPDDQFVDAWPKRLKYLVMAVDPATGRALKDGDYSAIVALGVGFDGKLYCEASMEKSGPQETTERMASFVWNLPMSPDIIAIESNGFQFLLGAMAQDLFDKLEVSGNIRAYDTNERQVPRHKEDRIAELDPLIVNKDIHWIRSPDTQLLVSQLMNFPSQDHDDGPDALELASWVMANLGG